MSITIEGQPVKGGMTVYFPSDTSAAYHEAQVIDTNEAVKAVKVLYYVGPKENKRGKVKWFAASVLKLNLKPQEQTPAAPAGQEAA